MGLIITKLLKYMLPKKDCRILLLGLDAAGKTTIIFKLKIGEVIKSTPTIGFNMETVEFNNIKLNVWDVGG